MLGVREWETRVGKNERYGREQMEEKERESSRKRERERVWREGQGRREKWKG